MLKCILLVAVLLGFAAHFNAQVVSEPQFEGSLNVPKYESGYVLDWDTAHYTKITLYSPDTKPVYSLPIRGTDNELFDAWAVDSDGTAARAYRSPRLHCRIDLLDGSGQVSLTIKTGYYKPTHITFAPDHTIWTVGFEIPPDRRDEDFNVVHHYTRSGEELGQSLPWSQIAGDLNASTALQPVLGGRHFFTSDDRLGFLSLSDRGRSKWIEVGFAGNLLGQYDLGPYSGVYFTPLAMTSSGHAYAAIFEGHHFRGFAVLDNSKGIWRKITGYPKGGLIGADRDNLLFSQLDGGWTVLHTVATAALPVEKSAAQEVAEANARR